MDLDRTNHWLNLGASIGVIIGLIFLIIELNQSNRIASYAAEHPRRNQFIEINTIRIENSEVYAKLQSGDVDLTPSERAQAVSMARQLINTWKDAESAHNYGLLSDETFSITLQDISVALEESPGLVPYFAYLIDAYELEQESSLVSDRLVDGVRRAGY